MSWVSLVVPPAEKPGPGSLWWGVRGSSLLVGEGGSIPTERPASEGEPIFLGMLDGHECWAVCVTEPVDGDGELQDLRLLHPTLGEQRWAIAGRAVQLVEWDQTHRFCGRCATPTVPSPGERARKCPQCGLLAFPRLAPAIITLVTRGDEALLAQGANFGVPMYSCLAGFVEPGETMEEAVAREVLEEVGVVVRDIRYQASQPWPFPHSLMLGFRAEWESGELELDPVEIVDAGWYRRDKLPMIPPGVSIARRLIDAWIADGT
ncbi:MAG: NAD(+) diphosphatase [Acidimicrobiales bacterium]